MAGRWMAVVAVAVVLSGCASQARSPGNGVSLGSGTTVTLADTPSGISGVLVDEAIRPIAGARVLLGGGLPDQSANTTADGLFTFTSLQPGLYTLRVDAFSDHATARRFLPTQTTAEVKLGETSKVRMVLLADRSPVPYHTTYKFDGFYAFSSGFADEILDLYVYNQTYGPETTPQNPGCTCRFPFVTDGPMQTLMLELQYEESSPTAGGWTMSVDNHSGDPTALYFCNEGDRQGPPCLYRVDAGADSKTYPPQNVNYTIGVWTDPSWVYVQESFQLYVTAFYVQPAPDGWSFVGGDT